MPFEFLINEFDCFFSNEEFFFLIFSLYRQMPKKWLRNIFGIHFNRKLKNAREKKKKFFQVIACTWLLSAAAIDSTQWYSHTKK